MPSQSTRIAIGVIYSDTGNKVLITRGLRRRPYSGDWQFPGKKLVAGENMPDALKQYLHQVLGLKSDIIRPLIKVAYQDSKKVILDAWKIEAGHGEIIRGEGQITRWVGLDALGDYSFPMLHRSIVSAVCLPSLYLISPDLLQCRSHGLERLEQFLDAGVKLFQLRCRNTGLLEYSKLVDELKKLFSRYNAALLLNADPALVKKHAVDGVHLNSKRLLALAKRPLDRSFYVGASCHDAIELQRAEEIDVDFVTVSPVNRTNSHTHSNPIGWSGFSTLIERANMPAFALGGVNGPDLSKAWRAGAQGLAMISGVWNATDPNKVINGCR